MADEPAESAPACGDDFESLAAVCRSFEQATGWPLELVSGPVGEMRANLLWTAPIELGLKGKPAHLRIAPAGKVLSDPQACASLKRAGGLAGAVAELWRELIASRRALAQREAELATGVPVAVRPTEPQRLVARLEAILQAGAESLNCHAAGLYLLDEATTELKLRASWGLPSERLESPARKLATSMADLEALLGHAVVLTDDLLNDYWHPPEQFGAAVCVPVASSSQQLGTLWVFANDERDFTDRDTNLLEVLAGSLACELERQVLADAALSAREQAAIAQEPGEHAALSCPNVAPLVDGWEVSGRVSDSRYCGAWYDWFSTADGSLIATLGSARKRGAEGTITAATIRAALRGQASRHKSRLADINSLVWSTSLGDMQASLLELTVAHEAGTIQFASAGAIRALVINHRKLQPIAEPTPMLGAVAYDASAEWLSDESIPLAAGKMLVAYAIAGEESIPDDDRTAFELQLADALCTTTRRSADCVATIIHDLLTQAGKPFREHAVLVIRRR